MCCCSQTHSGNAFSYVLQLIQLKKRAIIIRNLCNRKWGRQNQAYDIWLYSKNNNEKQEEHTKKTIDRNRYIFKKQKHRTIELSVK
jgi:hypothetical protein